MFQNYSSVSCLKSQLKRVVKKLMTKYFADIYNCKKKKNLLKLKIKVIIQMYDLKLMLIIFNGRNSY